MLCSAGFAKAAGVAGLVLEPSGNGGASDQFESAARAAGLDGYCFREHGPDGELIPAGARATYVPVYMIEPLPRNGLAVGLI